jgi:low affinity Fe/Cu permease
MKDTFRHFAHKTSEIVGSPSVFLIAVLIILIWGVSGPYFHYSDTWQLVINTGTTIITFLMVFLIQNTQNRDAKAVHLKLDELLRGVKGARTNLVNLENFSEEELEHLQKEFENLHLTHKENLEKLGAEFERRKKLKKMKRVEPPKRTPAS